jgi:hypothetical protein
MNKTLPNKDVDDVLATFSPEARPGLGGPHLRA